MKVSIKPIKFDSAVSALLAAGGLPTSDLADSTNILLFGHVPHNFLAGVVGLEMYGSDVLLRSLAVTESSCGTGIGSVLVAFAERYAAEHGVKAVYLLTTTASKYFEHHGYHYARRNDAPAAIASTRQFSELCPASSAFMVKRLDG